MHFRPLKRKAAFKAPCSDRLACTAIWRLATLPHFQECSFYLRVTNCVVQVVTATLTRSDSGYNSWQMRLSRWHSSSQARGRAASSLSHQRSRRSGSSRRSQQRVSSPWHCLLRLPQHSMRSRQGPRSLSTTHSTST